jgi:hypothetical protein
MKKAELVSLGLIIALAIVGVAVQQCKPGGDSDKGKVKPIELMAPTGLTAGLTCGNGGTVCDTNNRIFLRWTSHSNFANGDQVERMACMDGLTSGVWVPLDIVNGDTWYRDMLAVGESTAVLYHYRVKAVSSNGESDYSNIASAPTDKSPIMAPSNLVANTSSQPVVLSWLRNSTNEEGFRVERKLSASASYEVLAEVLDCATVYIDECAVGNAVYDYRISARNPEVAPSAFATLAVLTKARATPPAAPSNLSGTVYNTSRIDLSWDDNSNDEDEFRIERSDSVLFGVTVGNSALPCTVSYADTGLAAGTKYYYRIRAINAAGNSVYSNVITVTTRP